MKKNKKVNHKKKLKYKLILICFIFINSCASEFPSAIDDINYKDEYKSSDSIKKNDNLKGYSILNHEQNDGFYSSHSSIRLTNILAHNFLNGGFGNTYVAVGIVYFDFNNDGYTDYLLKRAKDGKFFFIKNEANRFKEVKLMKGGSDYYNKGARKIVYDDLNKDGYIDIVVSAADDNQVEYRGLFVLKGTENGFEEIIISEGESEFFHSVAIGDTNNDGYGDIIFGSRNYFYSFKSDFSFEKIEVPTCWDCGMEFERAITHEVIDINNDGMSDLIVGYSNRKEAHKEDQYYNSTAIYYGTGQYPYFQKEYLLPSIYKDGNTTYDVAVVDFDGDGDLDIFANTNNVYSPSYMIEYFENKGNDLFINRTNEIFLEESNINHGYYHIDWIKVIDIDLDGKMDLLIEGQNWKYSSSGGWEAPNFNGYKLNYNNKFERYYFDK